jgi:hypothetical protein
MRLAAWRLVLMIALFAGWLGYLGYLIGSRPIANGRSLVLSRPQLLVSTLDVVARVDDLRQPVKIEEILYPSDAKGIHVGDQIEVANLDKCRPTMEGNQGELPDWAGPGLYLLPLQSTLQDHKYVVAPTPPSPGYPPGNLRATPRIYQCTPQVRAEYREIAK